TIANTGLHRRVENTQKQTTNTKTTTTSPATLPEKLSSTGVSPRLRHSAALLRYANWVESAC
ncbi:hypothetical protein, partial [Bifidobacterium callitrichidarum]|uniref:hypothetical protein n=1 Tax=Bifidobacterium callitrichidarum TaxID=2052941 RepID=UPI0019D4D351